MTMFGLAIALWVAPERWELFIPLFVAHLLFNMLVLAHLKRGNSGETAGNSPETESADPELEEYLNGTLELYPAPPAGTRTWGQTDSGKYSEGT